MTSSNEPSGNTEFNIRAFSAETLLAKRPIDVDWATKPALSGYYCTSENKTTKHESWFKAELTENYNIEAVVLTGFANNTFDNFKDFKVFASSRHGDSDIDSIPDADFFAETFDKVNDDSLGYEWNTGSKVARTVGAGSTS